MLAGNAGSELPRVKVRVTDTLTRVTMWVPDAHVAVQVVAVKTAALVAHSHSKVTVGDGPEVRLLEVRTLFTAFVMPVGGFSAALSSL
jgi:hypothetical protein